MKNFFTLSFIQEQRLYEIINDDLSALNWLEDAYTLRTRHTDEKGFIYRVRFIFETGFMTVLKDPRLGGELKCTWDHEGEKRGDKLFI